MSQHQLKATRFTTIFFFLLALPLFTHSGFAFAATQGSPLDVVLVMDSSGSMKKTDPQELRKPAAKLLISLLGGNDRASVVSFSDQGYPVAYLTAVNGKQNQAELFAAVDRISNKGVYTNLLGGVQAAMRVIKRNPDSNHKPIIVLMTDGEMDLGTSAKNKANSDKLLNEVVPELKRLQIELHTVAFTEKSDKAFLEKLANDTDGTFNLARNDKQLHDVYTSVFEQNKQPNMLPFDGEKFNIDKAVKEVTIVGSKDSEDVALSLIAPDNDFLTAENKPNSMRWFVAKDFDLITIQNPMAGVWRLKSSTGKNKAYIITDLKFQLQVQPQKVAIGEGLMISAWLEDKGKTIDKPSILSHLAMELRVYTPDGHNHVLEMQPQTQTNKSSIQTGVYLNHIALPTEGRYQIEVIAKGSTFSRVRTSLVNVFAPINAKQPNSTTPEQTAPEKTELSTIPSAATVNPPVDPANHSATNSNPESLSRKIQPPPHTGPTPQDTNAANPQKTASIPPDDAVTKPVADKLKGSPASDHPTAPETAKPSVKNTVSAGQTQNENRNNEAGENGPDLVKALVIFMVINSIFALLGAAAYFTYRWKTKKSAGSVPEDADEREEERKAA